MVKLLLKNIHFSGNPFRMGKGIAHTNKSAFLILTQTLMEIKFVAFQVTETCMFWLILAIIQLKTIFVIKIIINYIKLMVHYYNRYCKFGIIFIDPYFVTTLCYMISGESKYWIHWYIGNETITLHTICLKLSVKEIWMFNNFCKPKDNARNPHVQ